MLYIESMCVTPQKWNLFFFCPFPPLSFTNLNIIIELFSPRCIWWSPWCPSMVWNWNNWPITDASRKKYKDCYLLPFSPLSEHRRASVTPNAAMWTVSLATAANIKWQYDWLSTCYSPTGCQKADSVVVVRIRTSLDGDRKMTHGIHYQPALKELWVQIGKRDT